MKRDPRQVKLNVARLEDRDAPSVRGKGDAAAASPFFSHCRRVVFGIPQIGLLVMYSLTASNGLAQSEIRRESLGERLLPTCIAVLSDKDSVVVGAGRPGGDEKDAVENVQVWSFAQMKRLWTPIGQRKLVVCVAAHPEARIFAAGGEDRTVSIWDLAQRRSIAQLSGHHDRVRAIAFDPRAAVRRIASASDDNTIRIWDYAATKEARRISTTKAIGTIVYSVDGKQIIGGDDRGSIVVWDAESGKTLSVIQAHARRIRSIVNMPDGQHFLSASLDGGIKIWNSKTLALQSTLTMEGNQITSVTFSPDGTQLITGGFAGNVELFDLKNLSHVKRLAVLPRPVASVVFSKENDVFLTADFRSQLVKWSLK